MADEFYDGAQAGYVEGYNAALREAIEMIREEFPDPNPLSSIFTPYIGHEIVDKLEQKLVVPWTSS